MYREDVTIANRLSTVKDADAIYSTFRHSRKPPRLRRRPRRLAVLTEEQLAPCAAALGALFRASVRALNSPLVTEVLNAIRPGRGPGTHTRSATSMRYNFARGSASCWVAPGIFASLFSSVSAAACTTALPKIQEEHHINIFRTIVIPTLFVSGRFARVDAEDEVYDSAIVDDVEAPILMLAEDIEYLRVSYSSWSKIPPENALIPEGTQRS
ncbi:hypothetical protein B0H13DRAFT_2364291 [Mycena leptocephala]|nr:hypothetical protein B0H13DRAFT_2364291 [Mycena leptocephala]